MHAVDPIPRRLLESGEPDLACGGNRIDAGRIASASLWLFRVGILGSITELLLLGHYEKPLQLVPVVLLGLALVSSFLPVRAGGTGPGKALTIVCVLMLISGPLGLLLHYQNNVQFEREMQPAISGLPLFWAAIRGAVPALAPGTMIYMGGLGLLYLRISQLKRLAAASHLEGRN